MAPSGPSSPARSDPLPFSLSEAELRRTGSEILAAAEQRLERLLEGNDAPTLDGFLRPLDAILLDVRDVGSHGGFVFNVHPEEAHRTAGRELSEAADRFVTAFALNARAYERLGRLDLARADAVTRHVVDRLRKEMRRTGVERPEEVRAELRRLSDTIVSVANQFAENIATHDRFVEVRDPADLAGLPPDYVASHPPGPDGAVRITTRYPDYTPVQSYADRPELRERLMMEFMNRSYPDNLPVLDRLLALRHEFATRLDYPAFTALVLEDKMMADPEHARRFLRQVAGILRPGSAADHERIRGRKAREEGSAAELRPWDDAYYRNKIRNEEYGVDARALRRFLPYGPVRDGLFRLCRELFDLEFVPSTSVALWHPSVEAYDVRRAGRPIGRCYLDVVPRDGKFSHAACFGVRTGLAGVQLPQAALVCNFVEATGPKESARMEYRDVVTFFHEFGHLLHAMFSGAQPWTLAHQLEWDFVEAPSLLFEEWARDPRTLGRFARDPETGEAIPPELLQRLAAAEAFGRPAFWMRQVALAAISFAYYDRSPAGLDTTALYRSIWDEHLPTRIPAEYHPQAAWGHLTDYSACYYTYVWSLVIARDLLTPFRTLGDLTDPTLARRYVQEILAPGGSRPAARSVEAFLGRPFALDAFEAWIREADPAAPRAPAGTA